MQVEVLTDIRGVSPGAWDALLGDSYPHLQHAFLGAQEQHGCLGEKFGWLPQHLLIRDDTARAIAAAPMYLKFNSYGEFVFDWAWADAYQRMGHDYYPKLVSASPYTPATGPKLLVREGHDETHLRRMLIQAGRKLLAHLDVSSLHWLFPTPAEIDALRDEGLVHRMGCQFHWQNRDYHDFEHFLSHLRSKRRKQIRRERRLATDSGLRIERLRGDQVRERDWSAFHQMYENTFDRRGGVPTLTLEFFLSIAELMPEQVLLVLAYDGEEPVAAAFNLEGAGCLYGRHWGCRDTYHSLHFELCYYQGLEHCIDTGLQRFEPGAQGEHKVWRGFLPTPTWSAHWLADDEFRAIIDRHLQHERKGMVDYIQEMQAHSPYREA